MKNLQVSLEVFEGPFDLLFKLIEKNKINIYDIPISKLTEQYITTINKLKSQNMEEMSQFLLMAATLLQIKSKMLIPKEENIEEEIDPREELVEKLLEYQKIKKISTLLKDRILKTGEVIFKEKDEELINSLVKTSPNISSVLENITLKSLYKVFQETLKRKELKIDKIRSGFNSVQKPTYSIKDKITQVKNLLKIENTININKLFKESKNKQELVITFLAVLELVKENDILIKQDETFANIFLIRRK